MALQRRTPMSRGGPLQQVSAKKTASTNGPVWSTLGRTPMPERAIRLRQVSTTRAVEPRPRTRPADPIPRAVRAAVHARSGDRCEICGGALQADWRSIQHRQRRGQGGRHDVTNLLDVCGPNAGAGCHHKADEGSDRLDNGWQVKSGIDPASVPVLLAGARRVLLTAEGGYEVAMDP